MDITGVNFAVMEEALQAVESKEQLYSIFTASATGKLDSEANMMEYRSIPNVLK